MTAGMPGPPSVLLQIAHHLTARPNQMFLAFVEEDGVTETRLTFAEWDAAARALAGSLVERHGFEPGDHALLVYPPSLDFTVAFGACMYAGIVPVPVAPPNPLDPQAGIALFRALCEDCTPRAILTNTPYAMARRAGTLKSWLTSFGGPGWPSVPWLDTLRLRPSPPLDEVYDAPPDTVALLQYTSGSTSRPKGVPLTHGNLAHQFTVHAERCLMSDRIRAAVWLPHFHDYFLVSSFLANLYHGGRLWFCSPLAFLKRPALWFELASRVRATHTAAPNFAYDLVVNKTTPEQRRAWDLSYIEQHLCGAEPIQAATFARFHEAFASTGLEPHTFAPGYGLAEHTVAITTAGVERVRADILALERDGRIVPSTEEATSRVLIGCGPVVGDIDLRIVDPETSIECPAGHIGEIWVDSPSKGPGYHKRTVETAEIYQARLNPDHGREYLRTGDLGALFGNELYVTGRLKEMIIVRGRNLYPHDLEATARSVDGVRPGGALAFAVRRADCEGYGILVEPRIPGETDGLATAVAAAVVREHHVAPTVVLVGPRGTIPKTTSGKLQRRAVADRYERRDPTLMRSTTPHAGPVVANEPDPRLRHVVRLLRDAGVLGATANTSLRDLGLDSIRLVSISTTLEEAGYTGAFETLLGEGTVADLVHTTSPRLAESPEPPPALSAFQLALLRDIERLPGTHVLSLPFTFEPAPDNAVLVQSLHDLIERYPLLGRAFRADATPPGEPLEVGIHACPPDDLEAELCARAAIDLPIQRGPAMAADILHTGHQSTVLLRMSHLAYDAEHAFQIGSDWLELLRARLGARATWRGALELARPYERPPADPTPFRQGEAAARTDPQLTSYWQTRLAGAGRLPLPTTPLTHGRLDTTSLVLATTAVQKRSGGTPFTTVLTAYQLALAHVYGLRDVVVASSASQRHRPAFRGLDGPIVQYVASRETVRGTVLDRFLEGVNTSRGALRHSALPLDAQLSAAGLPPYTDNIGLQATLNLYDLAASPHGEQVVRMRRGGRETVGSFEVTCPRLPAAYPSPRRYPLMLSVFSTPTGAAGQLRTHPQRVSPQIATRIVAAMQDIVRLAEEAPNTPIDDWLRSAL